MKAAVIECASSGKKDSDRHCPFFFCPRRRHVETINTGCFFYRKIMDVLPLNCSNYGSDMDQTAVKSLKIPS